MKQLPAKEIGATRRLMPSPDSEVMVVSVDGMTVHLRGIVSHSRLHYAGLLLPLRPPESMIPATNASSSWAIGGRQQRSACTHLPKIFAQRRHDEPLRSTPHHTSFLRKALERATPAAATPRQAEKYPAGQTFGYANRIRVRTGRNKETIKLTSCRRSGRHKT